MWVWHFTLPLVFSQVVLSEYLFLSLLLFIVRVFIVRSQPGAGGTVPEERTPGNGASGSETISDAKYLL